MAASLAVAAAGSGIGVALSGAGAEATNVILTRTNAFLADSSIGGAANFGATNVTLDAESTSSIDAHRRRLGDGRRRRKAGIGGSIGVSLAQRHRLGPRQQQSADPPRHGPGAGVRPEHEHQRLGQPAPDGHGERVDQRPRARLLGGDRGRRPKRRLALTGAGSSALNKLSTDVMAYISGDGTDGIAADNITLTGHGHIKITANVAAASLGIAGSGSGPVQRRLSIGVSLANNYLGNQVDAYIQNGHSITALLRQHYPHGERAAERGRVPARLHHALGQRRALDSATVQVASDFTGSGDKGSVYLFLGEQYRFSTASGVLTVDPSGTNANALHPGDIVSLADDYVGGGQAGAFYTFSPKAGVTLPATIDLGTTDYTNTNLWSPVTQNLGAQNYNDTSRWSKDSSITALSIAASLAAGLGGQAGIAVSGAGAESTNVILTHTDAYVASSHLVANGTGNVMLDAGNSSSIKATVVSASVALGFGIAGRRRRVDRRRGRPQPDWSERR